MGSAIANMSHVQTIRFLYKAILKLHRGLPANIQALGNLYVREEFKRHKNCTDGEAQVFMSEWTKYAMMITKQLGLRGPVTASKQIGDDLQPEALEDMREDQVLQLYELMQAARSKEPLSKT